VSAAYAIVAREPGGVEVLRRQAMTVAAPGPGEALVRHTAIGVNFIDTYFRSGLYPWPAAGPLILGAEAAGVVEAIGPGVSEVGIGDRIAYTIPNGAYASHRLLPAHRLVKIPAAISDQAAAAIMLKGLTVEYLINDCYRVEKGDLVLFHAAAGGVGLLAGQWLAAKGVTAIGTVGSAQKATAAAQNGYAHVINYRSEDFVARVADITHGQGVAAVYDSVGRDTYPGSLKCLRRFGSFVSFGQSSGLIENFKLQDLAQHGSLKATRPILFHFIEPRQELLRRTQALFAVIESGAVRVTIGQTFPLDQAAAAHEALAERRTSGATVLIP